MRLDTGDDSFRLSATAWLQSLGSEIIIDLKEVFRLSPGYYPTTLAELWREEISRRRLSCPTISVSAHNDIASLPVCHPGDYEWRFTFEAAATLLECAVSRLTTGATVAHLGTPTTFALGRQRHGLFAHALLDRSASVVAALRETEHVYCIDLMAEPAPALGALAAIVDPPWYPEDTRAFLIATSRVCAVGARIVLCQPTLATRPGVAEERVILLDELPRLGYVCPRVEAACVRYSMPHFEASSLRIAAPELAVPDDWRTGDLLILEKISDAPFRLPVTPQKIPWRDATFGPVRIKLRRTEGADLGSLVPGDVLDTVSRRDPIRQMIGLWTSGNRVYSLEHPDAIGQLIDLCHADVGRSEFTMSHTLAHARNVNVNRSVARRLFDLLLIELQEHVI